MELNIYTPSFEYLGVIDRFKSLRWRRQIFGPGEFEMHCDLDGYVLEKTNPELFVAREGYNELAVIEGRHIEDVADEGETIVATGQLSNSILGRAILNKTYNFNGPVEVAMRQMVAEQMPRVYSRIVLGPLGGFAERITAQVSYKNLLDVLVAMAKSSGVLFRLRPDIAAKRFVFETFKGVNKTVSQKAVPRLVFSDIDNTLMNPVYEYNVKNSKNFALVAGEGEGDLRTKTDVNRVPNGGVRREIFVDAKDIRKEELAEAAYIALLQQEGNEKLDETPIVESFEAEAEIEGANGYRKEWDVGDVVTAHKSTWGIIMDERITEAEEVFEDSTGAAGKITPVFGSPLPEKF